VKKKHFWILLENFHFISSFNLKSKFKDLYNCRQNTTDLSPMMQIDGQIWCGRFLICCFCDQLITF